MKARFSQKFWWNSPPAQTSSLFQNPAYLNLQDDREVVLAATSARGSSLVHASQRLRQERAVVLSAVSLGSQIDGRPDCLGVFVGDAQ